MIRVVQQGLKQFVICTVTNIWKWRMLGWQESLFYSPAKHSTQLQLFTFPDHAPPNLWGIQHSLDTRVASATSHRLGPLNPCDLSILRALGMYRISGWTGYPTRIWVSGSTGYPVSGTKLYPVLSGRIAYPVLSGTLLISSKWKRKRINID